MTVETTHIDGLLVVRWPAHEDARGFFRQTYQVGEIVDALGRPVMLRQGNHARSRPGVLRGFHAEPWDKLVYVVRGSVLAAVADVRPQSPTFGEVATFSLGDGERDDPVRLFIAEGLANSYCVTGSETVDYLYDVSSYWVEDVPRLAFAWNDPDLAVQWPTDDPILSSADQANPRLRDVFADHPNFLG